ncbi:DUF4386 domain-containing protein [Alteromonadaceae bacterium BrNp21-10]|nr:DUF4386 domain-containing protein [Alteromonadaceae bacterium BrNp21-10]
MNNQSQAQTARLAGALYLCMAPFAGFSLFVNFSNFVHDDPVATLSNIQAAGNLYALSIVTWLISQLIFILLVFTLYHLLKNISKISAQLMIILVLIGVSISFSNEIFQFAILRLVGGGEYLTTFEPSQINSLVVFFSHLHNHGIQIAHIFWGLWLFPLAYLIYRSGSMPKILAVLIAIAGVGYLADFGINTFVFDSGITVTQYTFLGEILFPLWLLIKGVGKSKK